MLFRSIFLVVAGSQPADLSEGLVRGALVLAGGVVQALLVAGLRTLFPRGFPSLENPAATPHPKTLAGWQAAARREIVTRFSLKHRLEAHVQLYRELLKERTGVTPVCAGSPAR